MKQTTSALIFILGFGAFSHAQQRPSVSTFSIPPFGDEATVVGIDGWKMVSNPNTELAIVRMHGGDAPGLLLLTYGIEKFLDEPMEGEVIVTAVVQFGRVSEKGSNSTYTFMPILGVGVGSAPFGFSNRDATSDEPGGFFYTERFIDDEGESSSKATILLPREEIMESAKYTLTMEMNLSARTFVLKISGMGMNGEPIEVKSGEIAMDAPDRFPSRGQNLRGIRLAGGLPPSTELFVESITIAPKAY